MKYNLRERLLYLMRDDPSKTNVVIAKAIIYMMDNIIDLDLTTLSNYSNTSKSTISKFCKEQGFKGFVDFKEVIMIEEARYFKTQKLKHKTSLQLLEEFNNKILPELKYISEYIENIDWLSKNISNYKKIFIFSSEENLIVGRKFYDELMYIGINVYFSEFRAKQMMLNLIEKDSLSIFIVSGVEDKLQIVWDKIIYKEFDCFLISTESQQLKFRNARRKVIINYLNLLPWIQSRQLILIYVIDLIFYYIYHNNQDYYQKLYNPETKT